jgi:glycosyltransferase involved in cell wall biosynthesis
MTSTIRLKSPRRIAKTLIKENPDIVLDTGSGPWGDLLIRMTKKLRWISVIHDAVLHQDRWRPFFAIQRALLPLRCRGLIGVSSHTATLLREQHPSIPIISSRHGVICESPIVNVNKIAENRKRFIFFGRIEAYKGLSVLLEAFELARQHDPDVRLTVCGEGLISKEQRARAERLGVLLRNEWIDEREIDALFSEAGVVVLPYLSATQSGVAAIAMAKGLPAIATSVGALPEQVLDGISGRIVPPGDAGALSAAMIEIAGSEEIALEFATGSLSRGKTTYKWDTIADELINDLIFSIDTIRLPT